MRPESRMNRTQPIRKPKNRYKYKLNQHRRLARAICARIFQKGGKLYLVSRTPNLATLEVSFAKLTVEAFVDEELLTEIAFSGTCDGQLTRGVLNEINQSLESWRKFLDANDKDKSLAKERTEIKMLREKVDLCFGLLSRPGSGSSLVLSPSQEFELHQIVGDTDKLSELERCLVKLVYWFSGRRAAERFIHILANIVFFERNNVPRIDKTIAWLQSIQRRTQTEPEWLLRYEVRRNEAFKSLTEWIKGKPLPWKNGKGSLDEKLQQYLCNLQKTRHEICDFVGHFFPTTMAAWAICDRGSSHLPLSEISVDHYALNREWLIESARNYVSVSHRHGYNDLLQLVNDKLVDGLFDEKLAALDLLDNAWSINHIKCLRSAIDLNRIEKDVDPAKLCQLTSLHSQVMVSRNEETISCLQDYRFTAQRVDVLLVLFRWLARFPVSTMTKAVQRIIQKLVAELVSTFDCTVFCQSIQARLQDWSDLRIPTRSVNQDESNWPTESKRWLRRLCHYRQLTGKPDHIPKSLRRRFQQHEKRANEIAYLQAKIETGSANKSQQDRLVYLSSRQEETSLRGPDLHTTREACLFAGLDAFRGIFSETAREIWNHNTGCDIAEWSTSRRITMARWVSQMSPVQRQLMRQTITAWQNHGEKYKLQLPFNEKWIWKAIRKKVKLTRWLCPIPYSVFINDHLVTLRAVANPIEIYFMGTYFNTCLSQGGCNEMSVLANAAHVNKQVIYAYGEDGTVIGRQLIAMNSEFQLVGFHNYVNCDGVVKTDSEEIIKHFARFARRIAHQANISIPSQDPSPSVDNPGGHFWYDDGVHPWHAAIHEA